MPSIGLVVEGIYDEAVLTELIYKCHSAEVLVISRRCGGATQLMKKFPGFLKEFQWVNAGLPVDIAIIIRDADHRNPNDLIAMMEGRVSAHSPQFPRKSLVIVQKLEAWLLADEEALSTVTGKVQRRISDPEKVNDPKARLRKILSDARIDYTPERARMIAVAARVEVLAARCPSFKRFQEAVVNG